MVSIHETLRIDAVQDNELAENGHLKASVRKGPENYPSAIVSVASSQRRIAGVAKACRRRSKSPSLATASAAKSGKLMQKGMRGP